MREQREAHPQQPTGAAGVYPRSYLIDHRPAGIFDPEAPELAVLARLWPCTCRIFGIAAFHICDLVALSLVPISPELLPVTLS